MCVTVEVGMLRLPDNSACTPVGVAMTELIQDGPSWKVWDTSCRDRLKPKVPF